jgi:hypothetical protein
MFMKKCFVITGYGIKKDYIKNREIDLDKTFKHIIKPVFEELGYECKRSCDYPPGMIDTIMYKGIYEADFVLADISTLNPNALYELGVRHALRPNTTLVICEDGILTEGKLPFDLNHITALSYQHDGKTLDIDVVMDFKVKLKKAVEGMVAAALVDSPVFTHLQGLAVSLKENISKSADSTSNTEAVAQGPSLSDMIDKAVVAMKDRKYKEAIVLLEQLVKLKPDDVYFIQQLTLATYKEGAEQGKSKDKGIEGNKNAYKILEQLSPLTSIDTETLGMAGAIHKNLYKLTGDKTCLEKSLRFYERGYYIANDYYNGINAAFLYWKMAAEANDKQQILFYKMQAMHIDRQVVEICNNLKAQPDYAKRTDKEWIPNTLAEAYFGLDDIAAINQIMQERQAQQSNFSEDSFMKQFTELKEIKATVETKLK